MTFIPDSASGLYVVDSKNVKYAPNKLEMCAGPAEVDTPIARACDSRIPKWTMSSNLSNPDSGWCIPHFYSSCGGTRNLYDTQEQCLRNCNALYGKGNLLTSSPISPSFQGGPTIFHKGIFLKQTPHIKN